MRVKWGRSGQWQAWCPVLYQGSVSGHCCECCWCCVQLVGSAQTADIDSVSQCPTWSSVRVLSSQPGFFLFFFNAALGMEPRALCVLGRCSATELYPQPLVSFCNILIPQLWSFGNVPLVSKHCETKHREEKGGCRWPLTWALALLKT
jgi:hypothetical protein